MAEPENGSSGDSWSASRVMSIVSSGVVTLLCWLARCVEAFRMSRPDGWGGWTVDSE